MSDLRALAERLEKATGPNDPCICGVDFQDALAKQLFGFRFTVEDSGQVRDAFSSLDAAVALCERVLPGCWWEIEREFVYDNGELRERCVGRVRRSRDSYLHVYAAPTPALALCLAVVRAKLAEAGEET